MNLCENCKHFSICAIRKQRDRLFSTGGATLNPARHTAIKQAVAAACQHYESIPDSERIASARDRAVDESRYGVRPRGERI